jgi:hypothetical protein
MSRLKALSIALLAGQVGALAFGFAAFTGFIALFTLVPLGHEKDGAIVAILSSWLAAGGGVFLGFWWTARRAAPDRKGLRIGLLTIAGLFGASSMALVIAFAATSELRFNHAVAHVEIRLPAGATVPPNGPVGTSYQVDRIDVQVLHGRQWRSLEFGDTWLRQDGARPVLMASGRLERDEKPLEIQLIMPGQPFRQFALDLAPNPEPTAGYGAWRRVSSIRHRGEAQSQTADPSDDTEMRVRTTRER